MRGSVTNFLRSCSLKCSEQTFLGDREFLSSWRFYSLLVAFRTQKLAGIATLNRPDCQQGKTFLGKHCQTKHGGPSSPAFIKLVPGADLQTFAFSVLCIGWRAWNLIDELTNQDSASGKTVLSWHEYKLTGVTLKKIIIGIRQLFSREMALNIHEKGFIIARTI